MINNISTGILSHRFPQKITFFPKNASQNKIKLYLNKKFRNKSKNIANFATTLLPNVNINTESNKYLDENFNDNKTFKNSFSSTFYTTNSNMQKTIYNNTNNNSLKNSHMLSHKQLILLKANSFSKKKKIRNKSKFF